MKGWFHIWKSSVVNSAPTTISKLKRKTNDYFSRCHRFCPSDKIQHSTPEESLSKLWREGNFLKLQKGVYEKLIWWTLNALSLKLRTRWANKRAQQGCRTQVKWSETCSVMSDSLWPHGYSVHGILQARILEWVAVPSCRGSSQPRDRTQVSGIAGGFFTSWATREACRT